MGKKVKSSLGLYAVLLFAATLIMASAQQPRQQTSLPTPKQLWERCQETLPPFSFIIEKDEIIQSDIDPRKKLRRIEVRFISQEIEGIKMGHTGVIFMPADTLERRKSDPKGKVVVVTHRFGDGTISLNDAEPISARTGYPTMDLLLPGDYDGEDGEMKWLRLFRQLARDTKDPIHHDLFRSAVPYIRALDVFSGILKEKEIRAVIGGHSKRAYYAYTAAAIDPERIAGVVYMGCERLFSNDERFPDPSEVASFSDEQIYPESLIPFHTQRYVKCPVLYLGATNEGGYAMFNINKIQERMEQKWTIEYIPNYRHESR